MIQRAIGPGASRGRRRREGAALIMVICVLGALALMIAAFAAITRLERAASQNYIDGERAKFLAWSGVERAKFELRRAASTPSFPLPWMAYEPDGGASPPSLELATQPSFRLRLDPLPAALDPALGEPGRPLPPAPSGVLGATYYQDRVNSGLGGDYYVLKVEDCNAKVHLNDQNPHLGKMLDTVALVVGAGADVGQRVVAGRPAEGYRSVEDLRRILGEADFPLVAPYVTCHGFIDRRVIEMGQQTSGGGGTVVARPANLVAQPRAPINVNTAALPVLVAVFNGIGRGADVVSYSQAVALAQAVIAERQERFATTGIGLAKWSDLYQFLLAEAGLSRTLASVVLANCNPNTDLNKFVPDLSMYRPVDKLDLTSATTELTFAPGGVFDIESLGVVLAGDDDARFVARVVAQAKVRSTVRVFERYVDRMQDDFEADRVDPASPSALPNLRDMTTLPEFRNAADSSTGLLAADYDGQLTFNVITQQEVSLEGGFTGFIGRDLNGKSLRSGGTLTQTGSAREVAAPAPVSGKTPRPARSVITGYVEDAPSVTDLAGGSDLHPFGARLGSDLRHLAFMQEQVLATQFHEVPESEIILTDGHGGYVETLAVIPAWSYEAVDAHAFELWFKPDHPVASEGTMVAGERQVIFEWESGGPRSPGAADPVVPGGSLSLGSFVTDVHGDNVANYLAAVAAGGPGPNGAPEVHIAGGGLTVPPPPLSEFFGSPLGSGPLPFDNDPSYPEGRDPEADAETYASIADRYFARKFAELAADLFRDADTAGTEGISWGTRARLQLWLERVAADAVSPRYRVFARFELEDKNEEFSSTSAAYERTWTGPTVRAGTWHHALFSFYALPPPDASRVPPERTNFFVDGARQTASTGDVWPTEIHAQARIAKRVVDSLAGGGIDIEFAVEDYRVKVEIPRGNIPIKVGQDLAAARPFRGLVDNVIFQGNWPKFYGTGPDSPSPGRFDLWRPTLGRTTSSTDDHHLRYTKRTQALEWDQPIRVVSYAWTAWKSNDVMGGALSLGLV